MPDSPYRLCAIDLDETLLNNDHQISPRNLRAVQQTMAKGVTVVLASGRMHESMLPYAAQLGLTAPLLSYNGAMVRFAASGETLLHDQIPGDLAAVVMDYCAEHRLQLNYYIDDHLVTAAYTHWVEIYHARTNAPILVRPDMLTALRGKPPTKMIIIETPERIAELLPHFQQILGEKLYVTRSNDEYLEFMPRTANKGTALASVAQRFGVAQSETVAFGDSWNDIPMIQWAGLGIAVANAKPGLLAVADRVIGRNTEDAVGVTLEELFEIH